MKTFKLDPEGIKEIRKKTLTLTIPIALVAVCAGLYMSSVNQTTDVPTVDTLPFVLPIILVALGFGLFSGFKRQKDMWNSYRLVFDDETITRIQDNVPTIRIDKSNITQIVESTQGHLLVKTAQRTTMINIPSSIQNRDEVLNALSEFGQLNKETGKKNNITLITSLGAIALMTIFFVSKEKTIIIPTGILLTAVLLWSFFEIQRSKLIDKKLKRGSYFVFLLLISIIVRLLTEMGLLGN